MQPIATTNASADITKLGKKYGNLHKHSCLGKWKSETWKLRHDKRVERKMRHENWIQNTTYLSQKESFGNIWGYFSTGCNGILSKVLENADEYRIWGVKISVTN